MNREDKIKELISKSNVTTDAQAGNRILGDALEHLDIFKQQRSSRIGLYFWRTIMKSPITKLAAAAVIAIVVFIGINQLSNSGTSLAWGEVADKIQASRGLIYRERTMGSETPDEAGCVMYYVSSTHSRIDTYKAGKITRTLYCDYDAGNTFIVDHNYKIFGNHPMEQRGIQDFQRVMVLKDWVRKVLSHEHRKLGRKTIEGLLCEGIETVYPIFGDINSLPENYVTRVWVSLETEYPVLFESGQVSGEDGKLQVESVMDQFQWDIELDPSEFEPKIPPADYEDMES
jgi:hypothetical protein